MSSTPRKTRASAPTEVAISVDPTPATVEVTIEVPAVAVKAEGRSEEYESMDDHDAEAQLEEPAPPLIPVEPVFACVDRRTAWEKRRKYLVKMITAFNEERLPGSGTKELRKFLQDMTVPRKCISEMIPEEI